MLKDSEGNIIEGLSVPSYLPTTTIERWSFQDLKPHPLNKELYEEFNPESEEYRQLEASIREHGIQQPLLIKSDGTILSGHRRYQVATRLLIEYLPCVQSLAEDDRVAIIEANRYRRKTASELMREAALLEIIVKEKADAQRLAGVAVEESIHTREVVSAAIGMKPRTFAKLKEVYEASKTNVNAAEELRRIDTGEKSIDAAHKAIRSLIREELPKTDIPDFIRFFNSWQFAENDPRFGMPYPGRIPGQIAGNLIYYYTEPGDLIVDPMAGGGSTIDAALYLGREALGLDLHPARPDIVRWDISSGFPPEAEGAQLIFMDPPYWNMKDEGYGEGSSSHLSLDDFTNWWFKVILSASRTVQLGGFVAVIMMSQYFRLPEEFNDGYIDWPFTTYGFMQDADLVPWARIAVTYATSLHTAFDVENAKKHRHFLPILGDIVIGRRVS
jgi:ParB-like chromosome segregation protein Spo0J